MSPSDIRPVHERNWHIFLSHSSQDKKTFVEPFYQWLTEIARIPAFYDTKSIAGGQSFQRVFSEAILECRALILFLSHAAVKSKWVLKEFQLAEIHQNKYPDFKIVTVVLDDECDIPMELQNRDHIFATDRKLTPEFVDELFRALYEGDSNVEQRINKDIYVSRTWRQSEATFADEICHNFVLGRFRLVGDSKDRPDYSDSKQRVYDIIESCGGLLGILPHRPNKEFFTSPYILDEIRYALSQQIPCVLFAEEGVEVPEDIANSKYTVFLKKQGDLTEILKKRAVESLQDNWRDPNKPQYVFFATNFKPKGIDASLTDEEIVALNLDHKRLNRILSKTIERITAMPCFIGEDIFSANDISVQQSIINIIRGTYLFIGDVSNDNINTLIETGVARGAGINHYMIANGKRHRPPFMLRDEQVFYYDDYAEMIGRVYMLIYPFRRRILNYELTHMYD